MSEELKANRDELGQQKLLNDRLETDLLQVNKHVNGTTGSAEKSGVSTPASQGTVQQDGLAGLNFGQKSNVS